MDSSFLLGMGKVGGAVKILLDIDKVLSADEMITIANVAETSEASATADKLASVD